MHMSWDDLQTVEALVRLESLESAAHELGLRHSSVSRRIAALEARLDAALFLRGTRLEPTKLARTVAARASAMRAAAVEIEAAVTAEQRHRAQRLVVTTNDVLAPLLFLALSKTGSSPSVDVLVSDTELALAPGEVDLALRPSQDPSGVLRGRRLGTLRLGVYRAPTSRPGWVLPSPSLRAKLSMRWWRHVPEDANATITCNSLLGIRDACRAGFGRSVLPCFLAQNDPGLRLERELDGGPLVWLLAPSTQKMNPRIRDARDGLYAALRSIDGTFHRLV